MDEYISRRAVLDIASQYCPDDDGSCSKADVDLREMLDEIEALPTTDVQPVKHAKWILFAKDKIGRAFYCSNCRKATTTDDFENSPLEREEYFCSRCGAIMGGEQNDRV